MLRPDLRLSIRTIARGLLLSALLLALAGCTALPAPTPRCLISTYPALEKGLYDGDVTVCRNSRRRATSASARSTAWTAR